MISNTITITFGDAAKLTFTTDPTGAGSGNNFATQPVVKVQDSAGNTVTSGTNSNASITLAINTQPAGVGSLTCTTNPLTATSGTATFAGCKITGTAGTYTLSATASGLATDTSNNINITFGTATKLGFATSPSNAASGSIFATQPVVTVQDSAGNTVTSGTNSTASITIAINSQPGSGATLACTANTKTATAGVDTFAACKITGTAGTYTLSATASGLTSDTSGTFAISAAPTITFPTTWSQESIPNGNTATFTIVGTGFQSGLTVSIAGGGDFNGLSFTFVDSSHISVTVTAQNGGAKAGPTLRSRILTGEPSPRLTRS